MTVSEAVGDIFDYSSWKIDDTDPAGAFVKPDALGHGVNCYGVMGSGIAVLFRKKFPEMYEKYKLMCDEAFLKPGMAYPWLDRTFNDGENLWIYNIASQFKPGADAHLEYLDAGLYYTRFHMLSRGVRHLALPRIGAGIGGLKWEEVQEVVYDHFAAVKSVHVTLVSLEDA